jgi:hypothetical protein
MRTAYLEVLVRRLLPLLGHGARRWLGKHTHGSEETERNTDTNEGVKEDLATLIGRGLGTGSMSTEGNPVCCK